MLTFSYCVGNAILHRFFNIVMRAFRYIVRTILINCAKISLISMLFFTDSAYFSITSVSMYLTCLMTQSHTTNNDTYLPNISFLQCFHIRTVYENVID